jgi:pimeloyl-ACP methyl ester carboxylesterase
VQRATSTPSNALALQRCSTTTTPILVREPYAEAWEKAKENPLPNVQMPVLMFHGLDDWALNAHGLNDTWEWVDRDLTLVTVPGSGYFVQQDAAKLVSTTMKWWLLGRDA